VAVGGPERFFEEGDPPAINVEAAGAIAWTQGAVTQAGWLEWLSGLPLEISTTLPDGTKVLAVHIERLRLPGARYSIAHLRGERQSTGREFIQQHLDALRQ